MTKSGTPFPPPTPAPASNFIARCTYGSALSSLVDLLVSNCAYARSPRYDAQQEKRVVSSRQKVGDTTVIQTQINRCCSGFDVHYAAGAGATMVNC